MPQDGSNNYQYPPGTPGIPDQTIESESYNTFLDDLVVNDLNIPRPIHRGGTAATTATEALTNLSGEKAQQVVTNYDSMVWMSGSFYSAAGATAAPNGHRFLGYVAVQDVNNIVLNAFDLDSTPIGTPYRRVKKDGAWGAWGQQPGSSADLDAAYVNVGGDTMTGNLTINKNDARLILDKPSTVGVENAVLSNTIGSPRWALVLGNNTAENGIPTDASGSNFYLGRYRNDGGYLGIPLSIARSTGEVIVEANPVSALGVATKQYADLKVAKTGDTMTGVLTVNPATGSALIGLNPTQAAQQATIVFNQSGVNKWQLGKQTTDDFFLYNNVLSNHAFLINLATGLTTFNGDLIVSKTIPTISINASPGNISSLSFKNNGSEISSVYDNTNGILVTSDPGRTTGLYINRNGSSWNALSDARSPEKVGAQPLSMLDRLDALQVYENTYNGKQNLFVIAQEFVKCLPHLVKVGSTEKDMPTGGISNPDAWGVSYDRAGVAALQLGKEVYDTLLEKIEALTTRIAALESS